MWNNITNLGTITSLLGISAGSFIIDSYQSHFAAAVIFISVSFLTWRGYATLNAILHKQYEKGYKPIATFSRYSTSDGEVGNFEMFRHIQVKEPLMTSFCHKFYWTGSREPKITSSLQNVGDIKAPNADCFTSVDLKLSTPGYYNSSQIIHTNFQVVDDDGKAEPYIALNISLPMQLIHFRVELLHAKHQNFSQKAYLERRSNSANSAASFDILEHLLMDVTTKAYEFIMPNPEPGFTYRLRWDRIRATKAQTRNKKNP